MKGAGIWFDRATLPALPHVPAEGTLAHHLGLVFTGFEDAALSGTLPVDGRTRQAMGRLHGGASAALAETLMSAGAAWTVDPARCYVVGLELNASHMRGVSEGIVTGRARPLHIGRRTQVWACNINDAAGRPVCATRMTAYVAEHKA